MENARANSESRRETLARALQEASYEVLPFRTAEDAVLGNVPRHMSLTVTAAEARGLDPTINLATRLARHGYAVAPHLAAKLVRDQAHLEDIVAQLKESSIDRVFVIGGDAPEPAGTFADALSLLEALEATGYPLRAVGIGGYPEGHPRISDQLIDRALVSKAPHATHIVTQICFHAGTTLEWARGVKARGVGLPIRIGIPGAVNRQKLVRIGAGLGLGQSARYLTKQHGMIRRFFLPGGYSPDRLVERLAPRLGQAGANLAGFHVFTFNELEGTEAWRQNWLERLR